MQKFKWYEWLIAFVIFAICLSAGFGIVWLLLKVVNQVLLFLIGLVFTL